MESKEEIFKTADVILLIINNEGELVDDIEYPSEFRRAYQLLQELDIIKSEEGKFTPSKNFQLALKMGVEGYKESRLLKEVVLRKGRLQKKDLELAVVSSIAVVVVGYFYKKQRNS